MFDFICVRGGVYIVLISSQSRVVVIVLNDSHVLWRPPYISRVHIFRSIRCLTSAVYFRKQLKYIYIFCAQSNVTHQGIDKITKSKGTTLSKKRTCIIYLPK